MAPDGNASRDNVAIPGCEDRDPGLVGDSDDNGNGLGRARSSTTISIPGNQPQQIRSMLVA